MPDHPSAESASDRPYRRNTRGPQRLGRGHGLWRWLAAVPGRDSVERQHAAFVQVLVLALLPLLAVLFLYGTLTDAHALLTRPRSTALLVLLLATVGAGVAVRRGRLGWAVGLLCGALLLAEAQTLLATGVAHDVPSVIPLVIPMTLAGLLRGRRALVLVAGLCIALVAGVALLESLHAPLVGTAPPERHPTATAVLIFVLVVIVLGLLLDRCGLALRTALAAAEQRAVELQGEIAVRTQAQEALKRQALHDALTDMPTMAASLGGDSAGGDMVTHVARGAGRAKHRSLWHRSVGGEECQ